jgi:hypothetical protein
MKGVERGQISFRRAWNMIRVFRMEGEIELRF